MIKFGPSGNSESFYAAGFSHTEEAAAFVKKRGLDCFEYSFGRGVRMGEEKAISIGEAFKAEGRELSVHAPYFVNFANPDDEMAAKSYGYVLDSGKMVKLMGGERIVFHPAAQGKAEREEAVQKTEDRLKILRDYIYLNDMQDLKFCPETMGKIAQIGDLQPREGEDVTRKYLACDLLILDDLGTEMTTQFTIAALYQVVNTRLMESRATIVSTNLPVGELDRRYSAQIASRLLGAYTLYKFSGKDIRMLQKAMARPTEDMNR